MNEDDELQALSGYLMRRPAADRNIDGLVRSLIEQLLRTPVSDTAEVTRLARLINHLRELSGALEEREDEDHNPRQSARHQT